MLALRNIKRRQLAVPLLCCCLHSVSALQTSPLNAKKSKLFWFRDHCLRTLDNEALVSAVAAASAENSVITPVFLWSGWKEDNRILPVDPKTGGSAKDVFVSQALHNLNATLQGTLNIGLIKDGTEVASVADELEHICARVGASEIYYSLSHLKELEDELLDELKSRGLKASRYAKSFSLLDYTYDRVTVPWKEIILEHPFRSPLIPFVDWIQRELEKSPPEQPLCRPAMLDEVLSDCTETIPSSPISTTDLICSVGMIKKSGYDWGKTIANEWPATEGAAMKNLHDFLASQIPDAFTDKNNDEEVSSTKRTHFASRLSPYLARGLLSPRQVYHALHSRFDDATTESFIRRLCWRDYTYGVMALFPDIEEDKPIRNSYYNEEDYDIKLNKEIAGRLDLWKKGQTGFPLVDAGMRQLIAEGWMPQKVRLVVSAFLVEGMGIQWEHGCEHFEEFLVDCDKAINSNMWQNAGSVGFDPYYLGMRLKKRPYWDDKGTYVRTWVPELASMPDYAEIPEAQRGTGVFKVDCLYEPWTAPDIILEKCGITLGRGGTYSERVVDERACRRDFFCKLRLKRREWKKPLIDDRGRDNISLGRNGERVGIFTPKPLLDKRQFR